jgi:lambda repressor-like predicted transcriptional regulator
MGTLPTYLLTHTDEQRLVIFRTDGADITDEEADWFRNSITAALRTEALMKTAGTNMNAVLAEPDVTEGTSPRTGAVVGVHPLVNRIKRIIKSNGWSLAKVSRLLGKGDAAVSTWFRGQAQPTLKDVYGLFGMAGYKLMPVPLELVEDVEASVAMAEEKRLEDNEENALG